MATNIPPHNLRETIDAVVRIIDNKVKEDRATDIDEVMKIIKGPDFPTGAVILGRSGINQAYRTGRGKIIVRAVTNIETLPNGRQRIIVTELPYMVNKAKLIEKIAELVKDKRIDGISDLRDESNREGMRIVIELKKAANANVVLNLLYKHTQLQDTFGANMLALVNNEPVVLNILQMLELYLKHQEEVVTRRTRFELNKAEERAHILKGLLIALDHIDEVIRIIRSSENVAIAKTRLMESFSLSDPQAQAIVDMRLRTLTGLEREKLQTEYDELMKRISELKAILADEKLLLGVVRDEILEIRDKYGDDRRTSIGIDDEDITVDDLIKEENNVLALTKLGYIKRMTMDNFRTQNRGGHGIKGMTTIDEDIIVNILMANTHNYVLFYTSRGRVFRLKGYQIPEASRTARGTALVNLLQLEADENVTAVVEVNEYDEDQYLMMATRKGIVKKTSVMEYENIRKSGLKAIVIREDDELIEAKLVNDKDRVYLMTRKGMCICFNEEDARELGRSSMGVRGIHLDEGDEVVSMQIENEGKNFLFLSENGLGKRTAPSEFDVQKRGGKGRICYKITEKSGDIAGVMSVDDGDEIMVINTEGIIIRMPVSDISVLGRYATGVRLVNLDEGTKAASFARITEKMIEEENESLEEQPETTEDE